MLIDFFENYYFIYDSSYVENKALVGMMEYFKDFDGDIIEHSKKLKREKELMGKGILCRHDTQYYCNEKLL